MTITQPTRSAEDVLQAARSLSTQIAARAAEVEAGRRVPRDLVDLLAHHGCFSLALPASHGGVGADLPTALQLFEELARADASVGWTVMIGSGAWIDLAHLERPAFDALFEGRDHTIVAGAFNPTGQIEPVDGGYRVTGRWAFASGCEHADWIFGNCIEGFTDEGPILRVAVFPRDEVTVEDTWDAIGLRGTGSHHFHVDGAFVPASRTALPLAAEPCLDEPITRLPAPALLAPVMASVALGIAQGAVDDIQAIAGQRMPMLSPAPLATDPHFHVRLAEMDTDVRAARALVHDTARWLWRAAEAGEELTLEERARARATAVWVVDRAAAVIEAAYRAGGSSAIYADCSLQRRLRDIHALQQHFLVRQDTMATAGSLLAGNELQAPVF